MGRTLPSATQILQHNEVSLNRFKRALRLRDQLAFEELFNAAQKHVSAAAASSNLLPFESTLLSMLLEAYKEVKQLRETTNELQMAVKELQDKYD